MLAGCWQPDSSVGVRVGMICPLAKEAAPTAVILGLRVSGKAAVVMLLSGLTGSHNAPEKPRWDPHVGLWCGRVLFSTTLPAVLQPGLFSLASVVTASLQSEQWGPGFPPPRNWASPYSRRDFGKEINTRWERAGLPGTHYPCAKSCWHEWVRGLGRAGRCLCSCRLLVSFPRAWQPAGDKKRALQPPAHLCPHRCQRLLGQGTSFVVEAHRKGASACTPPVNPCWGTTL